ncbi:MAG: dihydrolipoamide acetyltransferase family protein, partial [Deltaproteobacteria bacterium]|nr:dihydrolipoamide acetyltransferase family protein [Deltaproteobacteria bacterium]
MAKEIIMPKLGAEMTAGKIVEWKKTEGEWLKEGEVVVVIETDKITYEVESPGTGYLVILKAVDEEVSISVAIGMLCDSKEEMQSIIAGKGKPPAKEKLAETMVEKPVAQPPIPSTPREPSRPREEIRISPLARKLASEHGLDIGSIEGTGPSGRIEKRDVNRVIESRRQISPPTITAREEISVPSSKKTVKQKIPIRGMRKVIAERLYGSLQQMAQFSEMGEIDVTETVNFRQRLLEQEKLVGGRISFNDILIKVVALALKEMSIMNASVVGEEIHAWNEINIGVAVALEEGLIVPVIRDADKKSIVEVHHQLNDLIERARNHKLTSDEISGGTFTISNFGSYGAYLGTPIINPPEVALLGVGVIREVPVVLNHEIVIRWSMSYGLTMDHRVIDGATGGRFI